ncbi:MAG: DUF1178 family protein [Gemmobacter sp.]
MIRYDLRCRQGHEFDSWFSSSSGFESLRAAGHLSCPICGGTEIDKALMAPALGRAAGAADAAAEVAPPHEAPTPEAGAITPAQRAALIAELRARIEASSDYVGLSFATEARRMHEGDIPGRPIHGEAHPDEARQLIEDGIPVAPLPFVPTRRRN